MRFYEKDELNIPKRYKNMSIEQLRKEGRILGKIAIVISKVIPSSKKKINTDSNIKFYL